MRQKKIVVDLGKLKTRFSGLGEISYNFAFNLVSHIELLHNDQIAVYLLVPKNYVGKFGDKVKYIPLNFFTRHFPWFNKPIDLWYAVHQDSGYMPGNRSCKYLMTIHDLNVAYNPNANKAAWRLKKIQKKIDRSDFLTSISNFTKNEIQGKLNLRGKKIKVIHCGVVDYSNIKGARPEALKIDEPFFFHISTITPKKNTKAIIDMMKLLPEKKLIIAGNWENEYAKSIINEIEINNISNIIRLSEVNNEEKAWLYQNCEAFLFPSLLEGFGLPVIEAMFCGKPVFTSMCTSLPEIGSDKAFYWENFEPAYMKKIIEFKMNIVKANPSYKYELNKYANNFNWTNNILEYIQIFRNILSDQLKSI